MNFILHQLGPQHLFSLLQALQNGRLQPPYKKASIAQHVPQDMADTVEQKFNQLQKNGLNVQSIAFALELLYEEKRNQQTLDDRLELVWTGPKFKNSSIRDTAIVVKHLFSKAENSVLISSYSLDRQENMKELFGELAEKMDKNERLDVRLFTNIKREDDKSAEQTLKSFSHKFRQHLWPGKRLPQVFYDPRSLEPHAQTKACLHAKCIVLDSRYFFVTSANFSEAAHQRNIELGVLCEDAHRATTIQMQFETLIQENCIRLLE